MSDCVLESLRMFAANSFRLGPVTGGHWLAVGDAAMAFDPLSSQGICSALESGLHAAQAIERGMSGEPEALAVYARWLERTFDDYLRTRAVYDQREQRWPSSVFWQRRQRVNDQRFTKLGQNPERH